MPQLLHLEPGTRFRLPDLNVTGTLLSANECRARVRLDRGSTLVEFANQDAERRAFAARRSMETSWASTVVVEALSFHALPGRQTTMTTKTKKTSVTKTATARSVARKTATAKPGDPRTPVPKVRTRAAKKTAEANGSLTTTTTDSNLTIVDTPPATVETIDGPTTKPAGSRRKKPVTEPTVAKGSLSQLNAAAKVLGEGTEPMTTKQMVETMSAKGYWTSPGGKTPHATLYSAILRELQNKADASRFVKTERGHFTLRTA